MIILVYYVFVLHALGAHIYAILLKNFAWESVTCFSG